MARKVIWTEPAADDLVEAVEYLEQDSPSYATSLAHQVCDAGDSLAQFSERGRPFGDPAYPGYRELIVGVYRLVYEVAAERVVIHGVFHSSRDIESALRRRRPPKPKS